MASESQTGHRVLITGGGRGIGAAIGQRLAADGMIVGLLARTPSELDSTVSSITDSGGKAVALPCDVLDRSQLEESIAKFRDWAGGLDGLVCATGGIEAFGPLASLDLDVLRREIETGLLGVIQSIRVALPDLVASDRASVSVLVGPGHNQGLRNGSGYAATQAALVRLVESLGQELDPNDIRVFAVNPGIVPTRMMQRLVETAEGRRWLPQFEEAFAEGKEVPASVAANMVAWLIARRPVELNGRVVASLADPEFLETRLARIAEEDRSILRLR